MFVSYRWLEQYVELSAIAPEELAEKITRSGIEVEGIETLNKGISGVVVGHVVDCQQHPNADKLNLCKVDIGEDELKQIICGAPNVAAGQKVAVAKVGAVLPGNFKIKRAKLRGEVSEGMICSLQELGIEGKLVPKEYAEGIFVFSNDVAVGTDALEYLNLHDSVLELGLTPNRADCLSMLGVAYEVAAILGKEIQFPESEVSTIKEKASDLISVSIDAKEDNPYYAAKIVKGVRISPSPLWMQTRLMAAGIRPINNVVDITNYILLEYGQPLHAFDLDRLGSNEIVVRRATNGEKITTLDDVDRTLTNDHLVITNGKEPVALAGVMGGSSSEVQNDTVNVLIESAIFKATTIRKASKDHGLRSEASTRFEKGVDPERAPLACDRAARLMAELAGGDILDGTVIADYLDKDPIKISISEKRINNVLGTEISVEEIGEIFNRLKFSFSVHDGNIIVTVPSRRGDITIEEDLIEEVARLYGYDQLPMTLPIGESNPGRLTEYQIKRRKARRFLEGAGLFEVITYSLTNEEKVYKYSSEKAKPIKLSMPMSEERNVLRLSIIPHLLEVISHNKHRQLEDLAIFEIGSVFISKNEDLSELPEEKERLAGAITGTWHEHLWQGEKKKTDFFVLKGIVEGLLDRLGLLESIQFKQGKMDGLHSGRTAELMFDGKPIGFIGQVHPEDQKELDLNETYVFELFLERLFNTSIEEVNYKPIPRFPSITRDIALVVDEDVVAGDLKTTIEVAAGELLKEVTIFDLYQGEKLYQGKKSIAFSLKYFDPTKTLTDEEVLKTHEKVIEQVRESYNAVLRG